MPQPSSLERKPVDELRVFQGFVALPAHEGIWQLRRCLLDAVKDQRHIWALMLGQLGTTGLVV